MKKLIVMMIVLMGSIFTPSCSNQKNEVETSEDSIVVDTLQLVDTLEVDTVEELSDTIWIIQEY